MRHSLELHHGGIHPRESIITAARQVGVGHKPHLITVGRGHVRRKIDEGRIENMRGTAQIIGQSITGEVKTGETLRSQGKEI